MSILNTGEKNIWRVAQGREMWGEEPQRNCRSDARPSGVGAIGGPSLRHSEQDNRRLFLVLDFNFFGEVEKFTFDETQ